MPNFQLKTHHFGLKFRNILTTQVEKKKTDSHIFSRPLPFIFQSRAQPPEENKKKPVLEKLGNLFTSGRRRNTRNGLESPTSSSAKSFSQKDETSSQLPEREDRKRNSQGSQSKQTDTGKEGLPQEKPQELEGEPSETCVQAAPPDAELSPCSSSHAAVAVQQCHGSDSPQLEPLEAEVQPFPGATTVAKQLHSSLENFLLKGPISTYSHIKGWA